MSYIDWENSDYFIEPDRYNIDKVGEWLANKVDIGSLFYFKTSGNLKLNSSSNGFYGQTNSTKGSVFYLYSDVNTVYVENYSDYYCKNILPYVTHLQMASLVLAVVSTATTATPSISLIPPTSFTTLLIKADSCFLTTAQPTNATGSKI